MRYLDLFKESRYQFNNKPSLRQASIQADQWYNRVSRQPVKRTISSVYGKPQYPRKKTPLFDKNRNYTVKDIRQTYRDRKWPLYSSLEEFNNNPKKNGIFVADDGMIHAREVNPWTNSTVTRQQHASKILGKRFINSQ